MHMCIHKTNHKRMGILFKETVVKNSDLTP